jgi:hypothetical protein
VSARPLTHREYRALRLVPRGMSPSPLCWPVIKSQVFLDLVRKDRPRQRRQCRLRFEHAVAP